MKLSELSALSPLDGRYGQKTASLRSFFSESALMRYRILVEIRWLQCLRPDLSSEAVNTLEALFDHFNQTDAEQIKDIEKKTNHDVKAIEYFIKERIKTHPELNKIREWIHFGCTSEDINNLAYGLMLKNTREQVILPLLDKLLKTLHNFAHDYADVAMLSHTHGQKATPTTVGKEFANIYTRLHHQIQTLRSHQIYGKFNGAVGNFNAHAIVFPEKDWLEISKNFVEKLGLSYQQYTTQIEPHDYLAEIFQNLGRLNNILIDLSRDIWGYISLEYFTQKAVPGETGSSTMPHKVNPIDFENAEGNLYLSNSIFNCLAEKLPVSRFQRDLVDSTLLRNMGVGMGYAVVAYQSILKGLDKIEINKTKISQELNQSWEILAEPIQMTMRAYNIDNAYEKLKELTRGKENITQKHLHNFIDSLALPDEVKTKLRALTPENYIGYAKNLAENS